MAEAFNEKGPDQDKVGGSPVVKKPTPHLRLSELTAAKGLDSAARVTAGSGDTSNIDCDLDLDFLTIPITPSDQSDTVLPTELEIRQKAIVPFLGAMVFKEDS